MKTIILTSLIFLSISCTATGLIERLEYPYETFQNQKAMEIVSVKVCKCWVFEDRYIITCKLLSCDNGYRYTLMKWKSYKVGEIYVLTEEDYNNVKISCIR